MSDFHVRDVDRDNIDLLVHVFDPQPRRSGDAMIMKLCWATKIIQVGGALRAELTRAAPDRDTICEYAKEIIVDATRILKKVGKEGEILETITVKLYDGRITLDFNPRNHRYYVDRASPDGVSTIAKAAAPFLGDDWAGRINVREVRDQILAHLEATAGVFPSESELLGICAEAETYHQRVRDAAGDGGSATHDLIERVLTGRPIVVPDDPKVAAGFAAFNSWMDKTDIEFVDVERYVFSEKYFYAGRTDFVGRLRNSSSLIVGDFKTGSGFYTDQPYQIAGYAMAIEEETGEKIDGGLIIHLNKNTGKYTEYPVLLDDDMRRAWGAAVVHYKNLKRVRKMVEAVNGRR